MKEMFTGKKRFMTEKIHKRKVYWRKRFVKEKFPQH